MKRTKSAAALSLSGPRWDMLTVGLFSIFLFFAMHLWTERASVWFAFIALALCIGRTPLRLARERFCLPVIGFLAFMVVYGAAAIYSPFGGSAVRDFRGGLIASAVAALVLFRMEKKHVRGLLWGLAAVSAVVSLLSTDMACEGPFYGGFAVLMEKFGAGEVYIGLENTVSRVNGLYNDANVTGSLFALGTLLSLYLVQTGMKWWERLLACVLVSMSAMGILLSASRGAILCFVLSLVVWLLVVGKGQRLRLFLLMVISGGVCLVAAAMAMSAVAPGGRLPVVLSVVSSVLIFVLDYLFSERIACFLGKHIKLLTAVILAIVIFFGVYLFIALHDIGPYTFDENQILMRTVTLPTGTYTVSGDWDGGNEAGVNIYTRSKEEALVNGSTLLYSGPLTDAVFTLEKDNRVHFRFWGPVNGQLRQIVLSDGTEVPLVYKLLPAFLVNRFFEGFFDSYSYQSRIQFMKDALKIFMTSPLIGRGLGSTDNLYPAVQPFYYASRYVHSHILQVMSDQGLLGIIPFLLFLGGSFWLLILQMRRERDLLAAVLVTCWVMINGHGLVEINFSLQSYQCFAFVLLLLPAVLYGSPLSKKNVQTWGLTVCVTSWIFLAGFGGLMGLRHKVQKESDSLQPFSMDQLMAALDSYAHKDVFDPAPYQLEYVAMALQDTEGRYGEKMLQYVDLIRKSGNYPASSGLLEYYYLPAGDFKGLFECSRECLLQRMSYADVWNGQMSFYRNKVLPAVGEAYVDVFVEGVLAFQKLLEQNNQGRIEEIVLNAENQAFVDLVAAAATQKLSKAELYDYLRTGRIP